jgi:hypothetical protein
LRLAHWLYGGLAGGPILVHRYTPRGPVPGSPVRPRHPGPLAHPYPSSGVEGGPGPMAARGRHTDVIRDVISLRIDAPGEPYPPASVSPGAAVGVSRNRRGAVYPASVVRLVGVMGRAKKAKKVPGSASALTRQVSQSRRSESSHSEVASVTEADRSWNRFTEKQPVCGEGPAIPVVATPFSSALELKATVSPP